MRIVNTSEIENAVYRLALSSGVKLSNSCRNALECAAEKETGAAAKFALETLVENFRLAEQKRMPVCQDTGMAVVILKIGQNVFLDGEQLQKAVNSGVKRAYADGYFRKSVCDPLTRSNTGDNTPASIHVEIVEGDKVEINYLAKGFGSENMSQLYMLKPAQGEEGIINAIVETVKLAGSRPCPPVCVGVGIGGTFDSCAYLAKKALLRDIGINNERGDIAKIENEALNRINKLNIGCQGFHGNITALCVNCEWAPTHIAGLPVAVNIQCHCVRSGKEVL